MQLQNWTGGCQAFWRPYHG